MLVVNAECSTAVSQNSNKEVLLLAQRLLSVPKHALNAMQVEAARRLEAETAAVALRAKRRDLEATLLQEEQQLEKLSEEARLKVSRNMHVYSV
jgi:hypothetical protein